MKVLFADRIVAQIDERAPQKRLTSGVGVLFAKAGIAVPYDGSKIPIAQVDAALEGLSVQERLRAKCELRDLKLIA